MMHRLFLEASCLTLVLASCWIQNVASFSSSSASCALSCRPASFSSCTTRLFMSEPSDTSSDFDDFIMTIESESVPETAEDAVVSNVLDLLPNTVGGDEAVSAETRAQINEALYKLEALCTETNPTMSPLLNGVWELKYAGGYTPEWTLPSPTRQLALFLFSGGYSPGLFALQLANKLPSFVANVGDLEIAISRDQPRVLATVAVEILGSAASNVQVTARLEVVSQVRLRETYESATVLGNQVDIPSQLQYSRDLYVTYVDDDLLVVRDASGVPEVLQRKSKTFSQNWGVEPSQLDDMVPPGEE